MENNNSSSLNEALSDKNEQSNEVKESQYKEEPDEKNNGQCSNKIQRNLNDRLTRMCNVVEEETCKTLEKEKKLKEFISSSTKPGGDSDHANKEGATIKEFETDKCHNTTDSDVNGVSNKTCKITSDSKLLAADGNAGNNKLNKPDEIPEKEELLGADVNDFNCELNKNDKILYNIEPLAAEQNGVNSDMNKKNDISDKIGPLAAEKNDVNSEVNKNDKVLDSTEPLAAVENDFKSELNENDKIPENIETLAAGENDVNSELSKNNKILDNIEPLTAKQNDTNSEVNKNNEISENIEPLEAEGNVKRELNKNDEISDKIEPLAAEQNDVNSELNKNDEISDKIESLAAEQNNVNSELNKNDETSDKIESLAAEQNDVNSELNKNDELSDKIESLAAEQNDVNSELNKNDEILDNTEQIAANESYDNSKLNDNDKIPDNVESITVNSELNEDKIIKYFEELATDVSMGNSRLNQNKSAENKISDNLEPCAQAERELGEYSKISVNTESVEAKGIIKRSESPKKSEKNAEFLKQKIIPTNYDNFTKENPEKDDFPEYKNYSNLMQSNTGTKCTKVSNGLNLSVQSTSSEDKVNMITDNGASRTRPLANDLYSTAHRPQDTAKPVFPQNTIFSFLNTPGSSGFTFNIGSNIRTKLTAVRRRIKKTYKDKKTVYCPNHFIPVNYWCQQCGSSKCERCVNVAYSKTCRIHEVLILSEYIKKRKEEHTKESQKNSSACLAGLERNMKVLQLKESEIELQRLIQRERIRQEFISFHELLIEEEGKVMKSLEKDAEDRTLQMKTVETKYGSLVEEEAKLMCTSLNCLGEEDPNTENLKVANQLEFEMWPALQRKTQNFTERETPVPRIVRDKFTLTDQKLRIKMDLSTALDPVEVDPLFSTLFLDENVFMSPIKVCEMFTCRNSQYIFHDFELDVTVICNRQSITEERLRLNDYLFNIHGRLYLKPNKRYLVQARPVMPTLRSGESRHHCRHILIITGSQQKVKEGYLEKVRSQQKVKEEAIRYIKNLRSQQTQRPTNCKIDWNDEHYLKWKDSKLWPFLAVGGCKDFFDVSPEEMRYLAYSVDTSCYMEYYQDMLEDFIFCCTNANKWCLDLAFSVLTKPERKK